MVVSTWTSYDTLCSVYVPSDGRSTSVGLRVLSAAPPDGDTIAGADTLRAVPPVEGSGVGVGVAGSSPHAETRTAPTIPAVAIKDLNFTPYMRG